MKFNDLEIGQKFRLGEGLTVATKNSPTSYIYGDPGRGGLGHCRRDAKVIPEGEPPSSIEAAKRDARWWILDNMDVTADEAHAMRARDSIGLQESVNRIRKQKLRDGLDMLKLELQDVDEKTQRVLHDLIEIVRELV